jgi:hypothetical protein
LNPAIGLPWWGLLVAVGLAVVLALPIGIIQALSNVQIGLNVLTEMVCGYMLPGRPIANVSSYGYYPTHTMKSFQARVQNLWIHGHESKHVALGRFEIGTLCQNPATSHVSCPNLWDRAGRHQ